MDSDEHGAAPTIASAVRFRDCAVTLRDIGPDDRDRMRAWRNKPSIARNMYYQHQIGPEEHAAWFARIRVDPTVRYWIITYFGRPVGVINLEKIDPVARRCSFGIYLGDEGMRGKGIGSCAEYLLMQYVFDTMNFENLRCEVLAENAPAARMYKNAGFDQVGGLQKHVTADGRIFDAYHLVISREKWNQLKTLLADRLLRKGLFGSHASGYGENAE